MAQATIIYESESVESLTQPWIVICGEIVERFSTYMTAFRHIQWNGYELVDEQETAQLELNSYIEQQAEAIAPEARTERAKAVQVVEKHITNGITQYIALSNDNYYVVTPNHTNPKERCECGDCHYRGAKCKHQIAAELSDCLDLLAIQAYC